MSRNREWPSKRWMLDKCIRLVEQKFSFVYHRVGSQFRSIDLNNNGSAKATRIIGFLAPIIGARGTFARPIRHSSRKGVNFPRALCRGTSIFDKKEKKIFKILKRQHRIVVKEFPLSDHSISTPYFSTASVSFFASFFVSICGYGTNR